MEKNALKLLGQKLRHQLPVRETKGSEELRRLIVQLERRERELDLHRITPGVIQRPPKPH
jgi:hypothetical protein